jgi:hypothetical protein
MWHKAIGNENSKSNLGQERNHTRNSIKETKKVHILGNITNYKRGLQQRTPVGRHQYYDFEKVACRI